jgi:glucose-1-phosphate thymidylyltransferase
MRSRMSIDRDVLGLIPAAGRAERLGRLPCSKELLPVGFRETPPKVACHYLLDRFRAAGIRRAFLVLHESKWDVARYFGTGAIADMALAYLSIPGSRSVPETLDNAFPFVQHSLVALGFPDCLFEPADAYARLLERQTATGADLVLGLFPTERCRTTDMVDCGPDGRVRRIEVRPESTSLRYNWLIAVWTPVFTRYLHEAVRSSPQEGGELQIGALVRSAVESGLHAEGVEFPEGWFRDIGTPGDLAEAMESLGAPRPAGK